MQPNRADMQAGKKWTLFNNRGLVRMNEINTLLCGVICGMICMIVIPITYGMIEQYLRERKEEKSKPHGNPYAQIRH